MSATWSRGACIALALLSVSAAAPGAGLSPGAMGPRQRVLQRGRGDDADLFLWVHIGGDIIRARAAETTSDAVVTELWGVGTDAYRPLLSTYGGFQGWVDGVARRVGRSGFRRTCLTTWSAGSQVIKDVCRGSAWPDAIVSLDGIYGQKPPGARPGDGHVVWDAGLEAVTRYAIAAARGERILVLLHSDIATPYASSRETAEAIRRRVERALSAEMTADRSLTAADLGGHAFTSALELGALHIVAFAGQTAEEHIAEAHLFDAVWRRWIPWAQDGERSRIAAGR